jgi:hypothetical protein
MLREVLIQTAKLWFTALFLLQTRCGPHRRRLILFDIDNTLADSWPSLLINSWSDQNQRLRYLAVFLRMRRLVLALQQSPFNRVVFITARSNFSWRSTSNWLSSIGIRVKPWAVIITRTADDKLDLVRAARAPVVYLVDDLSAGHETGQTLIRHDLIEEIRRLPVRYYSKDQIDLFNAK